MVGVVTMKGQGHPEGRQLSPQLPEAVQMLPLRPPTPTPSLASFRTSSLAGCVRVMVKSHALPSGTLRTRGLGGSAILIYAV